MPTPTEDPKPTGGGPTGSATQTPSGSGTNPTTPAPTGGPGIGEACGPNDSCAAPATCVSYYGIAGPRGPQFKTCEVKCAGKGATCPGGKQCVTIADGPGSVCR